VLWTQTVCELTRVSMTERVAHAREQHPRLSTATLSARYRRTEKYGVSQAAGLFFTYLPTLQVLTEAPRISTLGRQMELGFEI
jgi:hypothetical protein